MFYLPTRIIYGENAVAKSKAYINKFGKKALIVTGAKSAVLSGAQDDIIRVLQALDIKWVIFNQVNENPDLHTIIAGAEVLSKNHCDFVIAIGGGSPIDAAKAIALTAANSLNIDQIYNVAGFEKSYNLVAIPTTSGTGTEVTQYSVLTDSDKQKKAGFGHDLAFPVLALADPGYTLTLSASVTLNTAIDALSHLLEGIYSNKRNKSIYPLIFQGVKLIYQNLQSVITHPDDYQCRDALMQASLYGGITISHTSTTLQHSIGYPLTSVFNVPHGLANGIVMKQMMDYYYPAVEAELDGLFAFLMIKKQDFYNWLDSLNIKAEVKITSEFLEARIPEVLNSRNMVNNPFEVSCDDIRRLYLSLV